MEAVFKKKKCKQMVLPFPEPPDHIRVLDGISILVVQDQVIAVLDEELTTVLLSDSIKMTSWLYDSSNCLFSPLVTIIKEIYKKPIAEEDV